MKKSLSISIVIIITAALMCACGTGTRPSTVKPQAKVSNTKEQISTESAAVQKIANYFTIKEYTGNLKYYTSKDFKEPEELTKAIQTISISNKDFSYTKLLQDEILARNKSLLQDSIDQKIFNFTTWYDQKAARNGTSKQGNLNLTERENLDRLNKIEKRNYALDYWDEITDPAELLKIQRKIGADELSRTNSVYFVRYFWPAGVGVDNNAVEWKTNFQYIGQVKSLDRENLREELYRKMIAGAVAEEKKTAMNTYKEETKTVYNERMEGIHSNINKIEQYEKLGGMLIPQGMVIFNMTEKKLKPKIYSYAEPKWLGVYAPIQDYQEGRQELYSYDATAFGRTLLISEKYVEVGTFRGQAIFNADEGYLEYVGSLPYIYKLDKDGKKLFGPLGEKKKKEKDVPDYFGDPKGGMNYDTIHHLSWMVNVEDEYNVHFYAIYSNLNWVYGYNMKKLKELRQSNVVELLVPNKKYLKVTRFYYGSLLVEGDDVYLGNALFKDEGGLKGRPVYFYMGKVDYLFGRTDKEKWGLDKVNNAPYIRSMDQNTYRGIPSFFGLPYAYDWSLKPDREKDLWIDIYPVGSMKAQNRIRISDLKIGQIVMDYVNGKKNKRKLEKEPEVRSIRYISDDKDGLIYFDVKLDMDMYDYSPLVAAVDREGNLKMLLRLWSAAGDKEALKTSGKMGPNFYDYRMVVLPDTSLFTVWNGSKGVGVGKFDITAQ